MDGSDPQVSAPACHYFSAKPERPQPRGFARRVGVACSGSSGQWCLG
jgi:hypothetical protein